GIDFADAVVIGVGDEDIAGAIHGNAGGERDLRVDSLAVIAAEPAAHLRTDELVAGDGGDRADGYDLAHDKVGGVQYIAVGTLGHGFGVGHGKLGAGGGLPIAGVASGGAPSERRDRAAGHFADAVVVLVGDIEVAGGVHRDAVRSG